MADLQITIDDGPQPVKGALTPILSELAARSVTAAFFNLGMEVKAEPSAAQTIRSQGHVLGNHSWDHLEPGTTGYTDAQILKQFQDSHNEVLSATKVSMKHWRAPRLQEISRLTKILTAGSGALYTFSHCDIHADSKDSQGVDTASGMLAAINADISRQAGRKTFRLLFHVKSTTAGAFKAVLDGLAEAGHKFTNFAQAS